MLVALALLAAGCGGGGPNTTFSGNPSTTGSTTQTVGSAPPSPQATLNPTSLSFGDVPVGSTNTQKVSLTNTGNANLNLAQVTVTGSAFAVSGLTASLTLAPSQSVSFTVQFSPLTTGPASDGVMLASNAVNSPSVLTLSGNGISPPAAQLTLNPTSINFGNVVVGNSSTQAVALTNTGGASLTITQANVTGGGLSTSGLTLPLTLTPGQSGSFNVRFAPSAAGSVTGSVSLVSNAANSPTAVSLSGNGVAPVLQLGVNPSSINFGDVAVGSSNSGAITLTNAGTAPLTITQATVTGSGFSISGLTLPLALAPAQTAAFNVQFAPAATGSVAGSVSLLSNATNSPTIVSLAGNGVPAATGQATLSSTSIDFGDTVLGTTSSQPVTLTNTGNANLTVSQVSVSGSGFGVIPAFSVPLTLAPSQSTALTVQFTPTTAGSVTGSVTLQVDGSSSISLKGNGKLQKLQLTLNPTSINYGNVPVGSTSTQTGTLTNTGNTNVTVNVPSVTGAGFSTNLTAQTLIPNQSVSFNLVFAPAAAGNATGSVSVTSTAPTVSNSLSGTGAIGTLTLNPSTINFGNVVVGSSATQSVTMTNTGNASLTVSGVTPSPGFTVTGLAALPVALNPGQSSSFNVVFTPSVAGAVAGSVQITSTVGNITVALAATGVTPAPLLSVSPTSISFGNVTVGTMSMQTATLTNTGNVNVAVNAPPPPGAGFSTTLTAQTLVPNQSVMFTVQFAPTTTVPATGSVSITSTAPTVAIALSGTGTAAPAGVLSLVPSSISFGSVVVGNTVTQAVSVMNTGNADLTITSSSVSPAGAGFSTIPASLSVTLTAGTSTSLTVQFTPSATGSVAGSVSFVSNASNSPSVTLSGTGLAQSLQLTVNPTSINFGNVTAGTTSTQTATLTNTGNVNVAVNAPTVTGAGFSTTLAAQTLTPGQSVTFNVQFAPAATGSVTGSVSITSTAPTVTISVSGTGVIGTLSLNPTSINFGSVIVGNSVTQSVAMMNTGNASLTITSATPSGAGFSMTGLTLPLTLAGGQSGSFTAQFAPGSAGSVTGSVTLASNASNSPTSVTLSGTGVAQSLQLTITPTSINFGNVTVGTTSTQTATLTNTGNVNVTVNAPTVTGTGFSTTLTAQTLTPNQSATFTVQFAPGVSGSVTGNVSITSTAPTVTITLSGSGTAAPAGVLSLNPSTISFGNVVVGNTVTQSVTMINTGNASLGVSALSVSGAGFSASGLTLPLTLAVGQSTTFTVQFAPSSAASVTGSVTLTSNGSNSPTSISLAGTGVAQVLQLTITPTSINFGNVTVATTSTQTATLTNTGNVSVAVNAPTVTGAGFSTTLAAQTLTPGQSVTFNVQFAPATTGSVTGSVSITSTAPTVTISLSGTGAIGTLTLNPSGINFGNVVVGNSATQSVAMMNTGNASLTITSSSISGAGLSLGGLMLPQTLTPGQSNSFTVQFAPASAGSVTGSVTLTSNASNSPTSATLSGTGVAQSLQLTVTPTSINFGNVTVGTTSTQTATLTNSGNVNVAVNAPTVTGAGFSTTLAAQTLTPGQSVTFNVQFAPAASGSVTGSVSITSAAPTVTISVSGTGAIGTVSLNPSSISFGSVIVGSSVTQSVTVTNTGNAALTITSATPSGAGFSVTGLTLPLTLAAGQSGSFTAQFAPGSAGSVTGSVTLASNASNSPTSVTLSGTGVAQSLQLTVTPTSINFGNVTVGTTSTQTATLTNAGNVSVAVNAPTVTGAGFSTTLVAQTLTSGQSVTFNVKFAPTASGSVTGSVSITSTAPTVTISVSGTGAIGTVSLNPSSINFGSVVVGSSVTQSVTVTNTGNASLTITSATPSGAGFSVTGLTLPLTLAAGQGSSFTVQFAPASAGSVTGSVTLASNASNSPTSVTLLGTGAVQTLQLTVNPTSINFGTVTTGTSSTQAATLTNTGNVNVTVNAPSVTGTGFSVSGLTAQTLTPGQSVTFNVQFAPTATGSVTGSVTITSTAPTVTISLSGTGGSPPTGTLTVNPNSVNFGSVIVGSTVTQAVTLTNTGNANLSVSQDTLSGTGFIINPALTLPLTLTPGQSASLNVQFTPTTATTFTGSVSFASNGSNSPTALSPLSGTGTTGVALLWDAATQPAGVTVAGYNVYRSTSTGGPFARLNASLILQTSYLDTTAKSATTYFYVATAVDPNGIESTFSIQLMVAVP